MMPNENRKKRNKGSVVFAVCMITGVALAAAAILVTMTLVGMPGGSSGQEPPVTSAVISGEDTSSTASETGSMTVSEVDPDTSSSGTESESSDVSDIELEGTTGEFVQSEDRLLVVVNNETELPDSFKSNLISAHGAKIDKSVADPWEELYDAGVEAGHYYWITYSYRSEKEQNSIYNSNVKSLMADGMTKAEAQAEADVTVQKGGSSEYITGLAIGVNTGDHAFGKTSDYTWLVENAPKYGFILRYPEGKEEITGMQHQPWRFRYVGKKHALAMQKLDMCLEEYVIYLNEQEEKAEKEAAAKAAAEAETSADTVTQE